MVLLLPEVLCVCVCVWSSFLALFPRLQRRVRRVNADIDREQLRKRTA